MAGTVKFEGTSPLPLARYNWFMLEGYTPFLYPIVRIFLANRSFSSGLSFKARSSAILSISSGLLPITTPFCGVCLKRDCFAPSGLAMTIRLCSQFPAIQVPLLLFGQRIYLDPE